MCGCEGTVAGKGSHTLAFVRGLFPCFLFCLYSAKIPYYSVVCFCLFTMNANGLRLGDGRILPIAKALDKFRVLFHFCKLCRFSACCQAGVTCRFYCHFVVVRLNSTVPPRPQALIFAVYFPSVKFDKSRYGGQLS